MNDVHGLINWLILLLFINCFSNYLVVGVFSPIHKKKVFFVLISRASSNIATANQLISLSSTWWRTAAKLTQFFPIELCNCPEGAFLYSRIQSMVPINGAFCHSTDLLPSGYTTRQSTIHSEPCLTHFDWVCFLLVIWIRLIYSHCTFSTKGKLVVADGAEHINRSIEQQRGGLLTSKQAMRGIVN